MEGSNSVEVRLARIEERQQAAHDDMALVRERVHVHASSIMAHSAVLDTVKNDIATVVSAIGAVGEFRAHVDECVRARSEDIDHRNRFEEKVESLFAAARKRQIATHLMIGTGLLTIIWYLVQTFVFAHH